MCLGVPGRVVNVYEEHDVLMGKIDFNGIVRSACLEHVPHVQSGDYVLVHVGYALTRIDEAEAKKVFDILEDLSLLNELDGDPP